MSFLATSTWRSVWRLPAHPPRDQVGRFLEARATPSRLAVFAARFLTWLQKSCATWSIPTVSIGFRMECSCTCSTWIRYDSVFLLLPEAEVLLRLIQFPWLGEYEHPVSYLKEMMSTISLGVIFRDGMFGELLKKVSNQLELRCVLHAHPSCIAILRGPARQSRLLCRSTSLIFCRLVSALSSLHC